MNAMQAPAQSFERPWLRFYDSGVPGSIHYPEGSLFDAFAASVRQRPKDVAWEFEGRRASYADTLAEVEACARALHGLGLRRGGRLLVALPTTPHAVVVLYAAARLGVQAAFVHPLSTAAELTRYLDVTGARVAVGLDLFAPALLAARPKLPLRHLVLGSLADYLPTWKRLVFRWLGRAGVPQLPPHAPVQRWHRALSASGPLPARLPLPASEPALILFSGGTSDLPKGILLSHGAMIAEGRMAAAWAGIGAGDAVLAILPVFHGFGLGVCINAALMAGGRTLLVPRFDAARVARAIRRQRPQLLVGVPTLYAALAHEPALAGLDWRFLRAAFCGADTLPPAVKQDFEAQLRAGGSTVPLLEGYGLTETVTAVLAMPRSHYREGSIGLPFPDMLAKICRPGGEEALADGEEGEICLSGPALMLGYLDAPEATSQALRQHRDGRTWLHTGDLGRRDADGFFYFSVRSKRLIKSSGYNVYPAQVEAVLASHPSVAAACVIGVPDPRQVERVVAVVVPSASTWADARLADALIAHCSQSLIRWSCPREVRFAEALPTTRVGKIDYRQVAHDYREQR